MTGISCCDGHGLYIFRAPDDCRVVRLDLGVSPRVFLVGPMWLTDTGFNSLQFFTFEGAWLELRVDEDEFEKCVVVLPAWGACDGVFGDGLLTHEICRMGCASSVYQADYAGIRFPPVKE